MSLRVDVGRSPLLIKGDFPLVSALMAVYREDEPNLLKAAVGSMLNQDYSHLEHIIVIDGPIGPDLELVLRDLSSTYQSLKIIRLVENKGLGFALNSGLSECKGEFVCRFDADDVSNLDRISVQTRFLYNNPSVDVLGCQIILVDEFGQEKGCKIYPLGFEEIKKTFWYKNPIPHPGVIFKRSCILKVGGYPDFRKSQDYALWAILLSHGYVFENLDVPLVRMTIAKNFYHKRSLSYFKYEKNVLKFILESGLTSYPQYLTSYIIRLISRSINSFLSLIVKK